MIRELGIPALVACLVLAAGCPPPKEEYRSSTPASRGKTYSPSSKPTGCVKGCRCGNSCIDCSKTCRK